MCPKQNLFQASVRLRKTVFLVFTLLIFTYSSFAQGGQGIDSTFIPVPSNTASFSGNLVFQPDGKILIFGNFQVVQGIPKNGIARLNADGTLDNSFGCDACDFSVGSVIVQTDGKILVAGGKSGPFVTARFRRLNSDGSLDTSFTSPFDESPAPANRTVTIWAVQPDGKIFASSNLSAQQSSQTLYRLNSAGTIDNSFASLFFSNSQSRHYLLDLKLLPDGKLMIGGAHTFGFLFRVNTDGTKDTSFESPALTYSIPQIAPLISDFEIQADGKIPFIGAFETVNGVARNNFARLNTDQSVDSSYNPSLSFVFGDSTTSRRIALHTDGKLLISGVFTSGKKLIRLNTDGSIDNTFNSPSNIVSLGNWKVDANGKIFIFADFQNEGSKFARLNEDGSLDATFNLSFGAFAAIYSTAVQSDGKVLIGGNFSQMNSALRVRIARVNADGTLDTSFDSGSGFDFSPTKLILQADGKILAIGDFNTYNGTPRAGFARLNADGTLDTGFDPTVSNVFAAAVQADGKILIGGNFTLVNGTTRTGIARLNADGSLDNSFNPTLGSPNIRAILVQADGKIMIGGTFTGVNGFNRTNLARLNDDGSLDTAFNAGSITNISELVQQTDGKYVGTNRVVVFRRNTDGTADSSFPTVVFGTLDPVINTILLQADGTIIVGGSFTTVGGFSRPYIVRLNTNGTLVMTFLPGGANGQVRTLSRQADNKIIVGGDFTVIGGVSRLGIARINYSAAVKPTLFDYDSDGRADISVFRPSENKWYIYRSTDGQITQQIFAVSNDIPVPADFDGDGKADITIFRPSSGDWWSLSSLNGAQIFVHWGVSGDIPRPSDFDGDGKADYIIFRAAENNWYRMGSTGQVSIVNFGLSGDKPVTGDFDGDGKSDVAIYRPSTGDWWWQSSIDNIQRATHWGISSDIPAPADYDGDGKTDFAVYRPSNGVWYIYNSSNGSFTITAFGIAEDKPVPADYDGDGKADIAVFRPSTGVWYLLQSTAGFAAMQFGVSTDVPTPNAFVP